MKGIILALIALLSTTAMVTALAFRRGDRFSDGHLARVRGKDAYYIQGESSTAIGPLEVPLRSADEPVHLLVGVTFIYRKSHELENAAELIKQRRPYLVDALNIFLSDRSPTDLETREGLYRLKRELRPLLEQVAFPGQEGRVERIYFDPILLQTT